MDTGVECGGWTDFSGPAWAEAVLDALEPDAWERVRSEVLELLHAQLGAKQASYEYMACFTRVYPIRSPKRNPYSANVSNCGTDIKYIISASTVRNN